MAKSLHIPHLINAVSALWLVLNYLRLGMWERNDLVNWCSTYQMLGHHLQLALNRWLLPLLSVFGRRCKDVGWKTVAETWYSHTSTHSSVRSCWENMVIWMLLPHTWTLRLPNMVTALPDGRKCLQGRLQNRSRRPKFSKFTASCGKCFLLCFPEENAMVLMLSSTYMNEPFH